jgi:ATP-dependent DNA helicase RecQ
MPAKPLPPARYDPPSESDADDLSRLCAEGHEALAASRQLARFLCGISSPATTRARLRGHPMFGRFGSVPFHKVLAFVEARR